MNWDDLRHFLAAYRQRSLAGAARDLGCEYTTVSRRIAALETALSTTLFTRTPEGLAPTPAADDLLALAEQIEQAAHAITVRAAGHDTRAEGVVRVTCPEGFSAYVIDRLVALRERHPGVIVEIIADVRALDLARGEADLALRMNPTTQRELVTRPLCEMAWKLFAAKAYLDRRGTPAVTDLRGHDVVTYDEPLAHVPGARWLAEHATAATVVFRGNSLHAVLDAAAAGLGLTVLPYFIAARDPRLALVAPDVLGTRTLSLVVHPDLRKVARIRVVMDFFADVILRDHTNGLFG